MRISIAFHSNFTTTGGAGCQGKEGVVSDSTWSLRQDSQDKSHHMPGLNLSLQGWNQALSSSEMTSVLWRTLTYWM